MTKYEAGGQGVTSYASDDKVPATKAFIRSLGLVARIPTRSKDGIDDRTGYENMHQALRDLEKGGYLDKKKEEYINEFKIDARRIKEKRAKESKAKKAPTNQVPARKVPSSQANGMSTGEAGKKSSPPKKASQNGATSRKAVPNGATSKKQMPSGKQIPSKESSPKEDSPNPSNRATSPKKGGRTTRRAKASRSGPGFSR